MRSIVLLVAIALMAWFVYSRYDEPSVPSNPPVAAAQVENDAYPIATDSNAQAASRRQTHRSDSAVDDKIKNQPKLVEVPLSATDRLRLIAAPQVFLNQEPSSALAQAMTYGRVAKVRADRVENGESTAVQGWIYYLDVAGYTPMVLCISETFPVLDWMHCQEHSDTVPVIITTGH